MHCVCVFLYTFLSRRLLLLELTQFAFCVALLTTRVSSSLQVCIRTRHRESHTESSIVSIKSFFVCVLLLLLLLLLGVMADPPILVPPKMAKSEDLHHHALEQLPNLAYCINDNPRWGKEVAIFVLGRFAFGCFVWFCFVYVAKMVLYWWWQLGKEVARLFLVFRAGLVKRWWAVDVVCLYFPGSDLEEVAGSCVQEKQSS